MDWERQQQEEGSGMFVKVMTDDQLEVLRKQIAAYSTICEQLVDLHKSLTSHHDLAGVRLGNLYCDPLVTSAGHIISGRQRWTPTPVQLQVLERIFEQGNGTPSKQKIKEITSDLSQHGQISETNVYNWFQNRRARSKRKQQVSAPNNAESEVETEVESEEKKTRSEDFHSRHNSVPRNEDLCFQNPEVSSGMLSIDPQSNKVEPMFPSDADANSEPAGSLGQMSFYGSMLSNPSFLGDNILGDSKRYEKRGIQVLMHHLPVEFEMLSLTDERKEKPTDVLPPKDEENNVLGEKENKVLGEKENDIPLMLNEDYLVTSDECDHDWVFVEADDKEQ